MTVIFAIHLTRRSTSFYDAIDRKMLSNLIFLNVSKYYINKGRPTKMLDIELMPTVLYRIRHLNIIRLAAAKTGGVSSVKMMIRYFTSQDFYYTCITL